MSGQRTGRLLRIPRTDTDGSNDFILLRASPSSSSSTPLDAYLLATEGEAAYGLKLRNSGIHKFLQKAFTGTHEEFRVILSSLLFQTPIGDENKALLEGFGISATVEGGTITLAVRKSVGGIKQRIAAIDIPQTEDEIELYNWVGEVCTGRDETESKLQAKGERVNELEKEVENLVARLEDLTALKKEHEDAMIMKFQELLNSKKQRIRELTRLVDDGGKKDIAPDIPQENKPSKSTNKGKNPRKRAARPVEESDESDGGFAKAVTEAGSDEDDVDSDQKSDPRTTEDEAEVETTGDEDPQHAATKIKKPPTTIGKGIGKSTTTAKGRRKAATPTADAKAITKGTKAGSKKPATRKAAPATRGRGRGKQAPKGRILEESENEEAPSPEPKKNPPLPSAPPNESDAMGSVTEDDDEL